MDSTLRQPADAIEKASIENWYAELETEPYKYEMFSTLRFLDAWHADKPRIGEAIKAADETVVLRQDPSMAFAAATISRFEKSDTDVGIDLGQAYDPATYKHQLYNLAFGLFGPNGAMPLHLTEMAFSRKHNYGDLSLSRFADVFHHRMLSLFYRAEANTQPVIEMDRPLENNFDLFVGSLAGLANKNSHDHNSIDLLADLRQHWSRLHRSGLLGMANKPADGLKNLLQDALKTSVDIIQFTGGWLALSKEDQLQVSGFGGQFQLGVNTSLGEKVFDVQHKFSIDIGPLDLKQFHRLLPNTEEFTALRELIRLYCGDEYDWDINLILKKSQIPQMQLGVNAELGWTSWMGNPAVRQSDAKVSLESKGF